MSAQDELRAKARAMWAMGDWDHMSSFVAPVGSLVVDRADPGPGTTLLDVGCGSGSNIAIPSAQRGAAVVGSDVTPELLEIARRHAADAGVDVEWVEADARELPFEDDRFDRVTSTFGAMFAPDHAKAAAELVRVCKPGGTILMATWVDDGFAGEMFKVNGRFLPPPPPDVQPPPLWGVEEHVHEMFGAAGASATIERLTVDFHFESEAAALDDYSSNFGPVLTARAVLEPQGRWDEYRGVFAETIARFNAADDGRARLPSDYFLITVSSTA